MSGGDIVFVTRHLRVLKSHKFYWLPKRYRKSPVYWTGFWWLGIFVGVARYQKGERA